MVDPDLDDGFWAERAKQVAVLEQNSFTKCSAVLDNTMLDALLAAGQLLGKSEQFGAFEVIFGFDKFGNDFCAIRNRVPHEPHLVFVSERGQDMKVKIEANTADIIAWHAGSTGLSADAIVSRLLSSHLAELFELQAFIEEHPDNDDALNLLVSYGGGETVMEGLRRIDPKHETLEDRFRRGVEEALRRGGGNSHRR